MEAEKKTGSRGGSQKETRIHVCLGLVSAVAVAALACSIVLFTKLTSTSDNLNITRSNLHQLQLKVENLQLRESKLSSTTVSVMPLLQNI